MSLKYYAHSIEGVPPSGWQSLEEHLKNVADFAAKVTGGFTAASSAKPAGAHHDIGKATMQ